MDVEEYEEAERGVKGRMLTYEKYRGKHLSDGRGVYVYPNNSVYEGEFRVIKGQYYKHGRGFLQWNTGDYYAGWWENGLQNGIGMLVYLEGEEEYAGEWLDGARTGVGSYRYADGSFYDGMWKNNKRHGMGYHVIFVDKEEEQPAYYKGSFDHDARHGRGTLHYFEFLDKKEHKKANRRLEGDWEYGELRKAHPLTIDEAALKTIVDRAQGVSKKAEKQANEIIQEFHNKLYLIGGKGDDDEVDEEEKLANKKLRRRVQRGSHHVGLTAKDVTRVATMNARLLSAYQVKRQRDIMLPPIAGGWRVEVVIDPQGVMMDPLHQSEGKFDSAITGFLGNAQTGWRRFNLHVPQGTDNLRYVATFVDDPEGELLPTQLQVIEATLSQLHGVSDDTPKKMPQYRRGGVAGLEVLPEKDRDALAKRQRPLENMRKVYMAAGTTKEKVYGETVLEEMDEERLKERESKAEALKKKLHKSRNHALKELKNRKMKEAEGKDLFF
uniref:Phosphatidylinositol-4-phosphate 5-kinase n=2 Tax=Palpitomonas bilix TaxID=652834 RepID=A0A7S3DEH2_9EUKA